MSANLIIPQVSNETDKLDTVVLGLPQSLGPDPLLSEAYDAKSYESIEKGIYPSAASVEHEMGALLHALESNGVRVLRPSLVTDYNQIFARDVCFVIDDTLFISNLIPDREKETGALQPILDLVDSRHVERIPEHVHTEGGDVILYNDILFVGCYLQPDYPNFKMARTNKYAIDFFKERFPNKTIVPLELVKHDHNPHKGVLHLDCAFQPIGKDSALIYPDGFLDKKYYHTLVEIFGQDKLFEVSAEEAYHMNTNIVSLSPTKIVSDEYFVRLNKHLESNWGIEVVSVPYQEISKMGGLLRCSTMPLIRKP